MRRIVRIALTFFENIPNGWVFGPDESPEVFELASPAKTSAPTHKALKRAK